ncbi:processed acidic surface protein [Bacillus marinisedimentorum]|uniref:processed acidic surface protein n=1 Tax=Bacillus marinisedimentorum TaxID=1821260 RepID=UPI000872D0AB|nr:processed acidic surface protein [Bacillus marinisedimentorum]
MKRFVSLLLAAALCFGVLPGSVFALEVNDPEFDQFLQDIGWGKQEYLDYLESKEWFLEDFETVDELGTPLTEKSVQQVLADYQISREELNSLLAEYGDIEAEQDVLDGTWIIFEEELDESVNFYLNGLEGILNDEDIAELSGIFAEFDLTEDELENLFNHLQTLNLEDPSLEQELLDISERLMAFEEFETADELSAEQIAELMDAFNRLLDIFEMDAVFYLVKDGQKQSVSLQTLISKDPDGGYDLLIVLYNKHGQFLADILFTAEMFGSDLITETGKDIQQAEKIVTETKDSPKSEAPKTAKGAKLPKTAGGYLLNAAIGITLLAAGSVVFRKVKAVKM